MRPEILFPLFTSVSTLKGVGPRVAPLVEKLAGSIARDVLFTAPTGLIRRSVTTVDQAVEGQVQTFVVTIDQHQAPGRIGLPWKIRAWDGTGFLTLVWFKGHGPHLERQHPKGARRAVSGKVERLRRLRLRDSRSPIPTISAAPRNGPTRSREFETGLCRPRHGLPSRTFRRFALEALEPGRLNCRNGSIRPGSARERPARPGAKRWQLYRMRQQSRRVQTDVSPLARRIAAAWPMTNYWPTRLALAQRKAVPPGDSRAPVIPASDRWPTAAERALPFRLTGAQIRSLSEDSRGISPQASA